MFIAFHNTVSGVGSTTLAEHTCALAEELGLRVSIVGSHEQIEDHSRFDLLIANIRPWMETKLRPDVWVVPMCDSAAEVRASELSDRLQGHLIWIGNKGHRVNGLPRYLYGSAVVAAPMPYSRAVETAGLMNCIVWREPHLADAPGATILRRSLNDLLDLAYKLAGRSLADGVAGAHLRRISEDMACLRSDLMAEHATISSVITCFRATVEAACPVQAAEVEASPAEEPAQRGMRQITDPGLAALIKDIRARLASRPSPLTPDEARLAASTGHQTLDVWMDGLHRDGRELVCGCKRPHQIARRLCPPYDLATRAGLCSKTIARFDELPGGTRLVTLVRIAVAMNRTEIFELQQRDGEANASQHVRWSSIN
jgi:hypothetical protein